MSDDDSSRCHLCLDIYGTPSDELPEGEQPFFFPDCRHHFGEDCLPKWFASTIRPHCPMCRMNICALCRLRIEDEPVRNNDDGHADARTIFLENPESTEILKCGHRYHHSCLQEYREETAERHFPSCPNPTCAESFIHTLCMHRRRPRLQNHYQTPELDDPVLSTCARCIAEEAHPKLATDIAEWTALIEPVRQNYRHQKDLIEACAVNYFQAEEWREKFPELESSMAFFGRMIGEWQGQLDFATDEIEEARGWRMW